MECACHFHRGLGLRLQYPVMDDDQPSTLCLHLRRSLRIFEWNNTRVTKIKRLLARDNGESLPSMKESRLFRQKDVILQVIRTRSDVKIVCRNVGITASAEDDKYIIFELNQ